MNRIKGAWTSPKSIRNGLVHTLYTVHPVSRPKSFLSSCAKCRLNRTKEWRIMDIIYVLVQYCFFLAKEFLIFHAVLIEELTLGFFA